MAENIKKLNLSALKKVSNNEDSSSPEIAKYIDTNSISDDTSNTVETTKNTPTPAEYPTVSKTGDETMKESIKGDTNTGENSKENIIEEKNSSSNTTEGAKKKPMISLSSIKSIPKKTEEKNTETDSSKDTKEIQNTNEIIAIKTSDNKKKEENMSSTQKNQSNNVMELEDSSENKEELTLTPEDTELVKEETKKLEAEIKDDLQEQEKKHETVAIQIDKNLFENYIPKYGKQEKKKKKEKNAKKDTTKKRIRGPINKKKQKALIVAMILCIMGAGTFALLPHLNNTDDIKANVIEQSIQETRQSVNNIINENETGIKDMDDGNNEDGEELGGDEEEINEIETDSDTENDTNPESEEKDGKKGNNDKVKSYLLDNYYK